MQTHRRFAAGGCTSWIRSFVLLLERTEAWRRDKKEAVLNSSDDSSAPSRSIVRSFFYRQSWVFVLLAYAGVLFSGTFPQDFRNASATHALFAWIAIVVRHYLFHIGILLALVAVFSLPFRKIGLFICTLPLLFLALGQELKDFRQKTPIPVSGETMSVMTFNLSSNNEEVEAVLAEIREAQPDVLLLQEYTGSWQDALHEKLTQTFPFHLFVVKRDIPFRLAVFSRREIDRSADHARDRVFQLGQYYPWQHRIVIHIADKPVALYNVFLIPPSRPNSATINRLQVAELLEKLSQEPLPAIVAGDFNFTHRSPQGKAMEKAGFIDAHAQAGKGRGGTWSNHPKIKWLPALRFDHIYLSKGLACVEIHNGQPAGSDHLPVIAKIGFARESGSEKQPQEPAQKTRPKPSDDDHAKPGKMIKRTQLRRAPRI